MRFNPQFALLGLAVSFSLLFPDYYNKEWSAYWFVNLLASFRILAVIMSSAIMPGLIFGSILGKLDKKANIIFWVIAVVGTVVVFIITLFGVFVLPILLPY